MRISNKVSATDSAPARPRAAERSELNGRPAQADDLRAVALLNYGHFTSMRVSDAGIRGLDLHLARLDAATRELFGCPLDAGRLRDYLRNIVADGRGDFSLRVNVFSRELNRNRLAQPVATDVLMTIGAARDTDATPLRLKSFRYERVMPHIKHVGTFGLFHHRRLAQLDGFDDALFVDASGGVSEASVWNIAFVDGNGIVWPDAPALAGISMQLLKKGLRSRGVATASRRIDRADIAGFRSAFLTNSSCPVRPIASIDGTELIVDKELTALLDECYAANPWQAI